MIHPEACTVRRAAAQDVEACVAVLIASITQRCAEDHLNDAETLAHWLRNKTPASFEQWLANPENFIVVAELESAVCGVALLHVSGAVRLCYVHPSTQRHGVGRALIRRLEEQAAGLQLEEIRLTSTGNARRFYEQLGFALSGEGRIAFGVLKEYPYVKRLQGNAGQPLE